MNHGKCKNCWWYWFIRGTQYKLCQGKLTSFPGHGICFMHSTKYKPHRMDEDSWCPDYINYKKEKMKLEDWIKETFKPEFYY